jgi:hypothetical protein
VNQAPLHEDKPGRQTTDIGLIKRFILKYLESYHA